MVNTNALSFLNHGQSFQVVAIQLEALTTLKIPQYLTIVLGVGVNIKFIGNHKMKTHHANKTINNYLLKVECW